MFIRSDQNLDKLRDVPLLFLENKAIKRVKATKSLGVHIDERLTWHEQIQNISKTLGAGISGLRRVREFVPLSTLLTIYNSLIQPLFDYCDVVWDSLPAAGASILQKLQNRALELLLIKVMISDPMK
jgi:hypothetical protein